MLKLMVVGALALCGVSLAPNAQVAFLTVTDAWRGITPTEAQTLHVLAMEKYAIAQAFTTCPFDEEGMQEALVDADRFAQKALKGKAYLTKDQRDELVDVMNTMDFAKKTLPFHCEINRLAFR